MSRRKMIIVITVAVIAAVLGYYFLGYALASSKIGSYTASLDSNLAAMRQEKYERPALFGNAREGDCGEELLAAARDIGKLTTEEIFQLLPKVLAENSGKVKSEKVRAFLKNSRPVLDRIYTAMEMEKAVIPFNFRAHDSMPSPQVFRTLGTAIILRARELKDSRHYAEALRWFFTAARFGQDMSRQMPLKYRDAGASTTVEALREAFRMLYKTDFGRGDLMSFLAWSEALEASEPDFRENLLAEQFLGEFRLREISGNLGIFPGSVRMPGTGRESFTLLSWHAKSWSEFIKWHESVRAGIDGPYPDARKHLTAMIGKRILGDDILRGLTWDFEQTYNNHVLSLTFCRAMRFLFWLRVFNAKRGRYPRESIEELADGQPADPFSSDRKFYYMHGYGETKFYSVGSDATHNNGDGRNWKDKIGLDLIFPASPITHTPGSGY